MNLTTLDIVIILFFFLLTLGIAFIVSKNSGKNSKEYFLSGRNMPWWLLAFSMVATTFSTDTPNLVTNIVRKNGVAGNWEWWVFLLTGLLTVFLFARLWRISGVKTDVEFYELRYGGFPAKFLRGFRAVYLGLVFNVLAMASVCLAAIKIGEVMFEFSAWQTIGLASIITLIFSVIGGLRGVIYTDLVLFALAMIGSVFAAIYCINLPEVGGLSNLIEHRNVIDKLDMFPNITDTESIIVLLIIPIAVQWWSTWYPGSEPGGGGYIAQRMLAAKNANHAIRATLFFNIMHYSLRPWPWILIALTSLIIFPDIESIKDSFPHVSNDKLGEDLAYPAMLTLLPAGLLGLVIASLASAYMSTISTHLNWGASYLVNDFFKRYIKPNATESEMVLFGRIATVMLMLFSALLAIKLQEALEIFKFIILFGAGTGLILIIRWFWWRVNAWGEIVAMFSSGLLSILVSFTPLGLWLFGGINTEVGIDDLGLFPSWVKYPFVVFGTTLLWLVTIYITKPEKNEVLVKFYKKTLPSGPGWGRIRRFNPELENATNNKPWVVPLGIIAMLVGAISIYGILFGIGYILYQRYILASCFLIITIISGVYLMKIWQKLKN